MLSTFPIDGKAWYGMLHMACCCGGKFAKQANSSYQTPRAAAPLVKILCPGGAGSTGICWPPT